MNTIQNLFPFFFNYFGVFGIACLVVLASTPTIMYTAIKHQLFDSSDLYRKNHKRNISNLGGVAIFCGFTLTILLFSAIYNHQQSIFLIISSIILFATGLKDDLYGIGSNTKLILNIVVAAILVFLGDFRLTSLYGVLNIQELNLIGGALFSMLLIIFLNNAFNLIDGIDGLAGTIGLIVNFSFGLYFAFYGYASYAFIAFALVGSIAGFLYYNFAPAKIFMGDTGALLIGMVSVVLSIKFIELNKLTRFSDSVITAAPAVAVAILIIPVFDSLRIFFIRIIQGKSPFLGDRNHIHHRLQNLGYGDTKIVCILGTLNILLIGITYQFQFLGNYLLITLLLLICAILNGILTYCLGKKRNSH